MKHDVLQILGAALEKVLTAQSSYIGSADCNWDDVAALVIMQCDGKLAIMSQDVFDMIAADGDLGPLEHLDEPIPLQLTEKGRYAVLTETSDVAFERDAVTRVVSE